MSRHSNHKTTEQITALKRRNKPCQPTHLTAFAPITPLQSIGRRDASGQSKSSCATGTMFFLSLSARAYSLRTKSAGANDCSPLQFNATQLRTLIRGVCVVQEPVHASLGPHQDDVFRSDHCFPQLLIESALRQRSQFNSIQINSIQFNSIQIKSIRRGLLQLAFQHAYLAEVIDVQKHFQIHLYEAHSQQLREI